MNRYRTCLKLVTSVVAVALTLSASAQEKLLYDTYHGQNSRNAEVFSSLLPVKTPASITVNSDEIKPESLKGHQALVLFSPTREFTEREKQVILSYLESGGSLLLIFDEERRTPMSVGVNDLISPFGMTLTANAPVRHNCGAIAEESVVCKERRELPYSGGRSVEGGTIISRVNDDGEFVHSAYTELPKGGKIIVMSDGMAGLLMGGPDGERFSGTGPADSKYWGKDSKVFMEEIFAFLLR